MRLLLFSRNVPRNPFVVQFFLLPRSENNLHSSLISNTVSVYLSLRLDETRIRRWKNRRENILVSQSFLLFLVPLPPPHAFQSILSHLLHLLLPSFRSFSLPLNVMLQHPAHSSLYLLFSPSPPSVSHRLFMLVLDIS